MIEDKSGNLWLGTNGAGLSKYNPSDSLFSGAESFTNFSQVLKDWPTIMFTA